MPAPAKPRLRDTSAPALIYRCTTSTGIVWQPGWQKTPPDERERLEGELIEQPAWVIGGVSPRVRKAADVVIYLDVSRPTAYYRCAKRNWRYLFRSRPELPEHCPEILILPTLCKMIWRFPTRVAPQILADCRALEEGSEFFTRGMRKSFSGHSGRCRCVNPCSGASQSAPFNRFSATACNTLRPGSYYQ